MLEKTHEKSRVRGPARPSMLEHLLIAGGLAAFLFLLVEMRGYLNPLLVGAAITILVWPLRDLRPVQALLFAAGAVILFWLTLRIGAIILPFIIMYVLAFLFDPVVTHLHKQYRVPRWLSSFTVTLLVVGTIVLILVLLIPQIISQLEILAARLFQSVNVVRMWLAESVALERLEAAGIIDRNELEAQIATFLPGQIYDLARGIPDALQDVLRSIGSIVGLIMIIAVLPVVLFYTLKDYPYIKLGLVELFPTFRGRRDYLVEVGTIVGNYLRGQLTISAIAAFNISFWLMIFDVPFALLIGIIAGFLNMIPNIGAVITNLVGAAIAIIFGDPWFTTLIIVEIVILGQQLLEQSFLTPKIMSYQVGLHPVLVILSLFVFGGFFGFLGLLIAVPLTALLVTVYKAFRKDLRLELSSTYKARKIHWTNPFSPKRKRKRDRTVE